MIGLGYSIIQSPNSVLPVAKGLIDTSVTNKEVEVEVFYLLRRNEPEHLHFISGVTMREHHCLVKGALFS